MALLRQLLLLPLLAPLLAVLLLGAVNPRPAVRLQLLVWRTPALPIGVWMMLAGAGGGLLSAGATTLALRGSATPLRRQVRRPLDSGWQPPAAERPAPEGRAASGRTPEARAATGPAWDAEPPPASAGPSRAPGEPPPTVAMPYRVIRRSASSTAPEVPTPPATGPAAATASATATAASGAPVAGGADASWDSAGDQDW